MNKILYVFFFLFIIPAEHAQAIFKAKKTEVKCSFDSKSGFVSFSSNDTHFRGTLKYKLSYKPHQYIELKNCYMKKFHGLSFIILNYVQESVSTASINILLKRKSP